jgi:phospholipase/carboxylesterase
VPDNNSKLFYLHKASSHKENAPLLVLLHGVGSNEQDLFSFADKIPSKYHVVSLRAPFVLAESSYGWYEVDFKNGKPHINAEQANASRLKLIHFLETLKSEINYNPKQVYLCGFSQGAIMSYSVALSRPDLVKGFAAMSGRLLEEYKVYFATNDNVINLKVLITHGKADPILMVEYAKEANAYLQGLGLKPELKLYDEVHTMNAKMLIDLLQWLK